MRSRHHPPVGGGIAVVSGPRAGERLTTTHRFISFLASPAVAAATCSSSFDPRELRNGRTTVYICIPTARLESMAPLQRIWLGTLLRTLTWKADESNPCSSCSMRRRISAR